MKAAESLKTRKERSAKSSIYLPTACFRRNGESIEPLFIDALLIAASIFVTGYRLGKPLDDIADSVKQIKDSVEEIKPKLLQILKQIEDLFTAIDKLEKEIKGYVDANEARTHLDNIKFAQYQISDWSKDKTTFLAHLDEIKDLNVALGKDLVNLIDYTGRGYATIIQIAPGFALWAQTYNTIERILGTSLTVWDSSLHKTTMEMFHTILDLDHQLSPGLLNELASMPTDQVVYEIKTQVFVQSTLPFKEEYLIPEGREGQFTLRPAGRNFFFLSMLRKAHDLNNPSVERWVWWPCDSIPPDGSEEGMSTRDKLVARKDAILTHIEAFASADKFEKDVLPNEVKPPEWIEHPRKNKRPRRVLR